MVTATTTDRGLGPYGAAAHADADRPGWLGERQRAAAERYAELGFPAARAEDWQHSKLGDLKQATFEPADAAAEAHITAERVDELALGCADYPRLVFVDGLCSARLSRLDALPEGLVVASLADELSRDGGELEARLGRVGEFDGHALAAMNTALFRDGALLRVARGVEVDAPVLLLYLNSGGETARASHSRILVDAAENSRLRIVERHAALSSGPYFSSVVSEFSVGEHANVEHVKLQDEGAEATHISCFHGRLGRGSRLASHVLHVGGRLVRSDVRGWLGGEGGELTLNGLHLLGGAQHVDSNLRVDHAAPQCTSHELYKTVLNDRSSSAFRGRIHVHRDAQKTDGYQTNQNLLLSDRATVYSDPQLEIYADDVKCSHGSTIGRLDETAMFYLRSRGLTPAAAQDLLVQAFAGEIVDAVGIDHEPLTDALRRRLQMGEPPTLNTQH
jgi:Fe-S cluster assembly protein SufD